MMRMIRISSLVLVALMLLALPQTASAYVGPGAGITVIGAALALIGGIVLAIFGFVWYPLKRLRRAKGKNAVAEQQPDK